MLLDRPNGDQSSFSLSLYQLLTSWPQNSISELSTWSFFGLSVRSLPHTVFLTLNLSFPPSDTHVSAWISACLTDNISWMAAHQMKLNPSKTEPVFIPANSFPLQDPAISLDNSLISSLVTAHNFGITKPFLAHVTVSSSEGFVYFFPHRPLRYLFSPFLSWD